MNIRAVDSCGCFDSECCTRCCVACVEDAERTSKAYKISVREKGTIIFFPVPDHTYANSPKDAADLFIANRPNTNGDELLVTDEHDVTVRYVIATEQVPTYVTVLS